jgi:menaquinone-dependent protoporphyrinogen IX oxidase
VKAAKAKPKAIEPEKKVENKTIVAYVTKGGATGEAANLIANTLREKSGLEVDVVNLRQQPQPDLTPYRNIVGGGVRAGKVYKEAVDFVKQDLSGKRVGIFICSGAAGNPRRHEEVADKYITKGLASNPSLKLVSMEAFGGCIKILGKAVTDRRDPAKVQAWAEELGKKLTE